MNKIKYNRKHMAAFLTALSFIEEKDFNLASEYASNDPNIATFSITEEDVRTHKCGTVACAAGWAAVDPVCNKLGFTVKRSPVYGTNNVSFLRIAYKGDESVTAVMKFLGIPQDIAYNLFGYNGSEGNHKVYGTFYAYEVTLEEVMIAVEYYCLTGELIQNLKQYM